jgi:membrane protein implicated in regulation of membrane protease activity
MTVIARIYGPYPGKYLAMGTPRMMILIFGALALMVGVIAALTLESWWILVAVMVVHGLISAVVIGYTLRQTDKTGGKPDPVTEARIDDEGSPGERDRMQQDALRG